MTSILASFFVSLLVSLALTPLVISMGWSLGLVDRPDNKRKIHKHPVPRIGGIAIFFAVITPCILMIIFGRNIPIVKALLREPSTLIGVLTGSAMIMIVGLVDDIIDLKAFSKLFWEFIISTVMYYFGFKIQAIVNPFGEALSLGIFSFPITIFWFMACMNAVNLLDGIDGLASGVCLFVGITLFILSMMYHNVIGMLLMACLNGSIIGFLMYNFPPAKIFLGDSGSLLLGFLVAALSLMGGFRKADTAVALLIPIIALGLPILDTFLAIIRRWFHRLPISSPDKHHIHHIMIAMGWSNRRAVLLLYGICILLVGASLLVAVGSNEIVIMVSVLLLAMIYFCFRLFADFSWHELVERYEDGQSRKGLFVKVNTYIDNLNNALNNASTLDEAWSACCKFFDDINAHSVSLQTQLEPGKENQKHLIYSNNNTDSDIISFKSRLDQKNLWIYKMNIKQNDLSIGKVVIVLHNMNKLNASVLSEAVVNCGEKISNCVISLSKK